ncbi:hypothetical protein Acor_36560 [Acrocarpospora corrugata]|uniref:non-specific serine/threonine protein kinase n=1 Tax=Acrocarpospora corrugata TaxID=35763 RepID=A0A5M3W0N3_9ACTN|nr:serine/threonine-protein kinase [Acrocarpospora corrugata]GES01592.1 hypothetical protein Acor_36560 [Acrocarpospora corrugata]
MAREKKAVDPGDGPVAAFAAELRRLRDQAGRPSYRQMGKAGNVSYSRLSEADRGYSLPTLDMVVAYVRGCGGDASAVSAMERRWRETRAAVLAGRDGAEPPAVRPLDEQAPPEVGGFRLFGRLGAGAMGRVYLAERGDGEVVAVKLIRPELADDPVFRRRFAHEVRAISAVRSPYIAPFVAADPDPAAGPPWLAAGYVPGPSLREAVAGGGLPAPVVARIAAGLAEALVAVHAAGIVHRDLKPANVLLTAEGPRVIDFGIARALDGTQLTVAGQRVGTPAFMAPEEIEDDRRGGPAADVFAFGAVLVYALTGRPPFGEGPDEQAVLRRVLEQPPDLSEVTDPGLRDLIGRCLEKDPGLRPTAVELAGICQTLLKGVPAGPGWLPGALQEEAAGRTVLAASLRRRPDRSRRRWSGAGVIVFAVVSVTVVSVTVVLPERLPVISPTHLPIISDEDAEPGASSSTATNETPAETGTVAPPAGDVNEQRTVRLHATEPGFASVEIDYWRQELDNPDSAPNGDLWMEPGHLYTVKSAALAKIESSPEATPARCARVTAWTTRIDFSALRAGDQLCARSAEGRYAMLGVGSLPASPRSGGYLVFFGRVWKQMAR